VKLSNSVQILLRHCLYDIKQHGDRTMPVFSIRFDGLQLMNHSG